MVCAGKAIASAAQSKPATQTRRQIERPALQICFPALAFGPGPGEVFLSRFVAVEPTLFVAFHGPCRAARLFVY